MAKKSDSTLNKSYLLPVSLLVCLLFLASSTALLHLPSLDNAWSHGFAHPLEGWDHIVTMIAVGIWAAQLRGHAVWLLPLVFVSVMSLGGIAGAAGILLPAVESIILLSCAVFSLFIIRKVRFHSKVNLAIVAFFAFFHGFAHGQEISASASLISYSVGFMLATLLLHSAGILVAKLILFCLTCLLAVLLPNLAQAAQTQTISKTNGNFEPVWGQVNFGGNSPWRQAKRHAYFDSEHFAVDDYNSNFTHLCSTIPDRPDSTRHRYQQRTQLTSPASLNKSPRSENLSGTLALAHQSTFDMSVVMPPPLALIRPDNSLNFAADFKHYYPDINYTPGLILLSNGAGLTSPPLALTAPACTTQLCLLPFILSVENRVLQITLTKLAKSAASPINSAEPLNHPDFAFFTAFFNRVVDLTNNAPPDFRPTRTNNLTSKGRARAGSDVLQSFYNTKEYHYD